MILAPTGSAAHLIEGNTIHDKLMFRPGNELTFEGEIFHKFDENMEKVKFIVIGIGINLVKDPTIKNYPTTNIFKETGIKVKKLHLIKNIEKNYIKNLKLFA